MNVLSNNFFLIKDVVKREANRVSKKSKEKQYAWDKILNKNNIGNLARDKKPPPIIKDEELPAEGDERPLSTTRDKESLLAIENKRLLLAIRDKNHH